MNILRRLWPFQRRLGKAFRVVGLSKDRRTPAQLEALRAARQDAEDLALERLWRANVAANELARQARRRLSA